MAIDGASSGIPSLNALNTTVPTGYSQPNISTMLLPHGREAFSLHRTTEINADHHPLGPDLHGSLSFYIDPDPASPDTGSNRHLCHQPMSRRLYNKRYVHDADRVFIGTGKIAPDTGLVFIPGKGKEQELLDRVSKSAHARRNHESKSFMFAGAPGMMHIGSGWGAVQSFQFGLTFRGNNGVVGTF